MFVGGVNRERCDSVAVAEHTGADSVGDCGNSNADKFRACKSVVANNFNGHEVEVAGKKGVLECLSADGCQSGGEVD